MKPEKPERKTRISLIEDVRELLDLSAQEKALLFIYASYANPDGLRAYPGRKLLSTLMNLSTKQIERYHTSLEAKGYLIKDGKASYMDRYRVNVPDHRLKSSIPPAAPGADISQEEWEAMMLPPEDDDETEMRMPVVKPPPAPPPETPAARAPAAKLSPEEVLEGAAKLVRLGMRDYEWYLKGGRKKGYTDEYLEWIFRGGGGQTDSSDGHQPADEPVIANEMIPETRHQTGMYQS